MRRRLGAICLLASVLTTACGGGGGESSTPPPSAPPPLPAVLPDFWVTNGPVNAAAITPDGRTIYIGGDFAEIGPRTGSFVAVDASSGVPSASFPKVNGIITAIVPDGAGGVFIGGDFSQVGNVARRAPAHILADGTVDPAWTVQGGASALLVVGSTLYVGRSEEIRAIDINTGATLWSTPMQGSAFAFAVAGATLYVAGQFIQVGGQVRNHLAALDVATGSLTPWNPNANAAVLAVSLSGATLFVGGSFTQVGGQSRSRLAALDTVTGLANSWNPAADFDVDAVAASNGVVYAGGRFLMMGGQPRERLAAIDAVTGTPTAWNPSPRGTVASVTPIGSKIYIGGSFDSIGGSTNRFLAEVDAVTGMATAWNPRPNNAVNAIHVAGDRVYAGGRFTSLGGQQRRGIAALDVGSGTLTSWNPDIGQLGVTALALSGSTLYLAGDFTTANGPPRNGGAAVNLSTGALLPWSPTFFSSSRPLGLVPAGNVVYVLVASTAQAFDAISGAATGWNANSNAEVVALAVAGSTVYIGGRFTSAGGEMRRHIAALDAVTGRATSWNPDTSCIPNNTFPCVNTLAVDGPNVYVAGAFSSIGGQARAALAALDTSTAAATNWTPTRLISVFSLAASGTTVYGAGSVVNGSTGQLGQLVAIDALSGTTSAFSPIADAWLTKVVASSGLVVVMGDFSVMNGEARPYFAVFRP